MTTPFPVNEHLLKLREIISQDQTGGWDKAWLSQVTPWDAGHPQPPLEDLLQSGEFDFPRTGKALVPGCGKGYDAVFIANKLGLQTIGADISPTAVTLANETLKGDSSSPSNVSFELLDFFKIKDDSKFDLVYDYTFFQALPPTLRAAWGTQMCNIVKPGGYLIILAFPIGAPTDVGPPFGIHVDSHSSVLGHVWEKLLDRAPKNSEETHVGQDRLMVWRKKLS